MEEIDDCASLAVVARFEQNNISYVRLIFTLGARGFCSGRDLDNTLASLSLPVSLSRYNQLEDYVVNYVKDHCQKMSQLQELRIRGLFNDLIMDLNGKALS